MLKHLDVCTHIKFDFDIDILKRKNFDVNLRLIQSSPAYRNIIHSCCDYILTLATSTREGYRKPRGFSGANAGIPFNIIATAKGLVMINPHIIYASAAMREQASNCGSLTLETDIIVARHACVRIEYWDREGNHQEIVGYLPTEQHEIDHNLGILITDRQI